MWGEEEMETDSKKVLKISVRNLVEFIFRSGDLDNKKGGWSDREAMLKGSRIHRKIQGRMGGDYQAEVTLSRDNEYKNFIIRVEGRADGILQEKEQIFIDEIKGVYLDLSLLEEPIFVHRAQAMCYAWMYASDRNLEHIGIQMTYCNLETEEIRRFREEFSLAKLEEWYRDLMEKYFQWADYQYRWEQKRNHSMEGMEFPFPYRKGQREIVAGVYHTIKKERQIFIQAPTGVGKTMSAVFPAVRAMGEGMGDRIFYLTAKTITRTVAEEAFRILKEKGLSFKTITITAKEKLCLCEEMACTPRQCPYAKGHFDRINDAVYQLWTREDAYDRERILEQARKWQVCPFELCLDLASWVDGIICDYNYVFDPNVRLKRFFKEGSKGDGIILIDEAHNLVDRGREMYSAGISKSQVLEIKKQIKGSSRKLTRLLEKINRKLLEYKRECQEYEIYPNVGNLLLDMLNFTGEAEKFLEAPPDEETGKAVLDFYFKIRDFLNVSELLDENYVIYGELTEDGDFQIKLFCVNPAKNLQDCIHRARCAVFFSATLLPMGYYKRLFSTESRDYAVCAKSPFPRENRSLLVGRDVSSRYTRRGEEEYRKIAGYIQKTVRHREGNYMVFFPSYQLMEEVYEIYQQMAEEEGVRCLLQEPGMKEAQREAFLENFQNSRGTLVGFCVMGGIFSEGIDLTGEQLIGAVIVGTGLPQISREREILKQFYDKAGENGFDYAYRFPGMNKVLQAAGRVIRSREDEGVILLLDQRFLESSYRRLFPEEWNDFQVCGLDTLEPQIEAFWKSRREATN